MKILVTGATGFLGGALVRKLHTLGYDVLATGRNLSKGRDLTQEGITFAPADLTSSKQVETCCVGIDVVIHSGAYSSLWGKREEFWNVNVNGTRNIVEGVLRQNVKRLIHISSPSIYFSFLDREDIHEDAPLPKKFINGYTASKYASEEEIQVGVSKGLEALILRPRAIYGPGDQSIFPRIVRTIESGRLRIIGNGNNKVDLTYIDNAVDACICAIHAPIQQSGRTYNITDGTPALLWPLLNEISLALGYPPPKNKIPLWIAKNLARGLEIVHRKCFPHKEPLFTAYSIGLLACSTTLNIDRARKELGYLPKISSHEGVELFLDWWKQQ